MAETRPTRFLSAENGQKTAKTGRMAGRSRGPGRKFRPGVSGNPGGRPKGSQTYKIRTLWAQALEDPEVLKVVVQKLRQVVTTQKTVVQALESAARINREVGLGSEDQQRAVTFILHTNIDPSRLKAGTRTNIGQAKLPRKEHA